VTAGKGPQASGNFITLEGGEGAGKTTQIQLLAEALKAGGVDPLITREPGGSPAAEVIRSLLVEGDVDRWQPMTEALLNFAARLEHVRETIKPALAAGRWVLSDRFADSTVAYQGYGHDLGRAVIEELHELVLGTFQPDLTLILDIPVEEGLARAKSREQAEGSSEDRYERMDKEFHQRLRDGFLDIARRNPERCVVIDAAGDPETVQAEIKAVVGQRLKATMA
jgi:dTMP kinase